MHAPLCSTAVVPTLTGAQMVALEPDFRKLNASFPEVAQGLVQLVGRGLRAVHSSTGQGVVGE